MKIKIVLIFIVILSFSCTKEVPEKNNEEYIPPPQSVVDKQFNFHIVDMGVWRSSQPNHESIVRMNEHGLKTIINLRGDEETNIWENALADSLGIKYFNRPIDAREKQDMNYLKEILSIVEQSENQPVLIHCLGGKDRTGLISAMYKLKHTNMKLDDIKKEMVMYGHDENYPEVFKALDVYYRELKSSD